MCTLVNAFVLFIREMEWRLDKEGREYHHYEDFCKLYRSEILNLNRMLDMLSKNGMLPGNLNLNFSVSNVSTYLLMNRKIIFFSEYEKV